MNSKTNRDRYAPIVTTKSRPYCDALKLLEKLEEAVEDKSTRG